MRSKLLQIFCTLILMSSLSMSQDLFIRSGEIPLPANEPGGFGEVVSGLDLDGDGLLEIYAVNNNWGDTPDELIPRIYMWEQVDGAWTLQWSAVLGIPLQNTWPALTSGDLDADGKGEVIWGPVNNFDATTNPNPARLIVFEANGNDNELGVSDGSGGWLPNSAWTMDVAEMTNMRPFKWFVEDIDGDGTDEVIFADRAGSSSPYKFGVASVDIIPDNGDGSETWSLEFSAASSTPQFVRSAVVDMPEELAGMGGFVAGVDFDGDGRQEIYAINHNWGDAEDELTPRAYKYEWNGSYWEVVWMSALAIPAQNTWPALTYGDWDADGRMEIIWGPVNFLTTESQNPNRVVVFESAGDGSDVMGVSDGAGNYLPNAGYPILDVDGGNERPFRWHLQDVDGDSAPELVYGGRAGDNRFGIIGVTDIPDNGDGSETWTMEANAVTLGATIDASTIYDINIMEGTIYLMHSNGNVTPLDYESNAWVVKPVLEGVLPGGSWKSSSVVDIEGDGTEEMIVGQWSGGSQVYLAQKNGDNLTVTVVGDFAGLNSTRLNGGAMGDIDGDGFMNFVFGSRATYSDPNSSIYNLSFNGGDITDPANYSTSIIDEMLLAEGGQLDVVATGDVTGDGITDVLYTGVPRSTSGPVPFAIVSYSDGVIPGGSKWDIAIANGNVYTIDNNGSYNKFQYLNGTWQLAATLTGVAGDHGSFKGSVVVDVDGDGTEEIIVGAWGSGGAGKVYLLSEMNGGLMSAEIADLGALGAVRLNGADAGDIDGDGFIDVVFGSRGSGAKVFRVEYRGGDIGNSANWVGEMIDELAVAGDQLDIINIANVDADADLEVIYSGIPRGGTAFPITILDLQKVQTTPIAEVRIDADGNFIPDNDGLEFTIIGVVTSINFQTNSGDLGVTVQDATAGIFVFSNDNTTEYPIGKLLQITGSVTQFNGLTEIVADPANIIDLGLGTVPAPKVLRVDQFLNNAEMYESMLIKIGAAAPIDGQTWPSGASGNYKMWDGFNEFTVRIDSDTDLDDNVEPTPPMSLIGVVGQYDGSDPYNSGYQLLPSTYATDIAQGLQVPPHPFMDLTSPAEGVEITITNPDQDIIFSWAPTNDLNGDNVLYQFVILPNLKELTSDNSGGDPTMTLKGSDIIGIMGGNTSATFNWTVRTTDLNNPVVSSLDTNSVTFTDNSVGVEDEISIPTEFVVDQNYPNPFNPTTTIQFGLPEAAEVDLRVYDILGREVATLVSNRSMNAGYHTVVFNANTLASGHYIYKLTAGEKTEIKKMLLLK